MFDDLHADYIRREINANVNVAANVKPAKQSENTIDLPSAIELKRASQRKDVRVEKNGSICASEPRNVITQCSEAWVVSMLSEKFA